MISPQNRKTHKITNTIIGDTYIIFCRQRRVTQDQSASNLLRAHIEANEYDCVNATEDRAIMIKLASMNGDERLAVVRRKRRRAYLSDLKRGSIGEQNRALVADISIIGCAYAGITNWMPWIGANQQCGRLKRTKA